MRSIFGTFIALQLWFILRCALLLLRLPLFSRLRPHRARPGASTSGYRVLITGRVDSKNWCMAHLLPLVQTRNIAELLLVVDGKVSPLPNTRRFAVPKLIGWLPPRTNNQSPYL